MSSGIQNKSEMTHNSRERCTRSDKVSKNLFKGEERNFIMDLKQKYHVVITASKNSSVQLSVVR